ncbi:ceramidase domain-containing protein [Marinobacterium jannaschii]|uniref:ceramidase domain-containing protein n=1 Tax=Marinobacterium jannaschii TaxID=64970 RepID=UPI0004862759|nr:ceramidase domain-containing protein [Marinobacterium jannaschii]
MIDLYCERLDAGFWAEPVNAITNMAFFFAAFMAWRLARERDKLDLPVRVLLGLIVAIGIGSSLFHTFASQWSLWADEVPIMLFQLAFLWLYSQRVIKHSMAISVALLLGFFGLTVLAGMNAEALNGSVVYLPAAVMLFCLALYHSITRHTERNGLMIAFGVFMLSLSLRTLDNLLCSAWPLGTHFGWHLLNALVLYLVVRSILMRPLTPSSQAQHNSAPA